jgi:SAM-dependent methyltransferase
MPNSFHEANHRRWDAGAASWARRADTRGIWRKAHLDPSLALHPAELKWLSDIAGKRIAVLGSGDNQVVFALAGLGAKVASIDISEKQIEVARGRAANLGLHIDFVRANNIDLAVLSDAAFEIVYTGGHVAVWVDDLRRYYGEATRILKPDGLLIVNEYHPFRRVWRRSPSDLEIGFNYFDRGPHRFAAAPEVLYREPGDLEQFEFHWTVTDYISAILDAGCRLIHVEEFGDGCEEWEGAPMSGLPEFLFLVGRRGSKRDVSGRMQRAPHKRDDQRGDGCGRGGCLCCTPAVNHRIVRR